MQTVLTILLIILIVYILFSAKNGDKDIVSHWYYHFEDLQTSSQEFYTSLESSVAEYQMPDLQISREWFMESNVLSSRREYLHIHRGDNSFHICAAPDGRCFFVSCWVKFSQPYADFLERIPFFGASWARNARRRTMYQQDTQVLFNETIKLAVGKAVDKLAETKGVRGLRIQDQAYA